MKHSIIAVAVLSSLFMSAGAFAEGNQQGELIITGKVVGTTCQFIDGTTATIAMNEIGADQFENVTVGGTVDTYSNKTTVPLKVQCTGDKTPRITFSSSQFVDSYDNITVNTASNNGAGFAVYYVNNGNENKITKDGVIELNGQGVDGLYTLNFSAKYAKPDETVTPGDVKSALTMTVVTD